MMCLSRKSLPVLEVDISLIYDNALPEHYKEDIETGTIADFP